MPVFTLPQAKRAAAAAAAAGQPARRPDIALHLWHKLVETALKRTAHSDEDTPNSHFQRERIAAYTNAAGAPEIWHHTMQLLFEDEFTRTFLEAQGLTDSTNELIVNMLLNGVEPERGPLDPLPPPRKLVHFRIRHEYGVLEFSLLPHQLYITHLEFLRAAPLQALQKNLGYVGEFEPPALPGTRWIGGTTVDMVLRKPPPWFAIRSRLDVDELFGGRSMTRSFHSY